MFKIQEKGKPEKYKFPEQSFCETGVLNAGCEYDFIEWDTNPVSNDAELIVTESGKYKVLVGYDNGFSYIKEFRVVINDLPIANLGEEVLLCDGATTVLDAGNYASFVWTTPTGTQTTQTITTNGTGRYSVVVSTEIGCTASSSTEVVFSQSLILATSSTEACGSNGSISTTVSGGVLPYTYTWTNANGVIVASTENATDLPAGNYTIEVLDDNGCDATANAVVTQSQYCSTVYYSDTEYTVMTGRINAASVTGNSGYIFTLMIRREDLNQSSNTKEVTDFTFHLLRNCYIILQFKSNT